jgi:hypothetical protein
VRLKRIPLFAIQHPVHDGCIDCVDQRDGADADETGKSRKRVQRPALLNACSMEGLAGSILQIARIDGMTADGPRQWSLGPLLSDIKLD